ncbi:MAG: YeeE/YedE family protein [Deltaproteobacteria bacterium]|nr:YeeE/YedE family protein [Deltaproteobacteria bacterium]
MSRSDLLALLAGGLFSVGLAVAGMTKPGKVVAFLDVTGAWDPSLAFVMVGALVVYGIAFRLITRREAPVLGGRFQIPTRQDLPPRLFVGAAMFGVGWGLGGYCPGPALTSLGTGASSALLFVPGMLGGMVLFHVWDEAQARKAAEASR